VVEYQQVAGLREGLCKMGAPELAGIGITPRQFEKETVARGRFDSPPKVWIINHEKPY
jgi:hypothetical protein